MGRDKKKIIIENQRTVLQPVLFSEDGEQESAILTPEIDTLDERVSYRNLRKKRIKRAVSRAILWTVIVLLLPIMVFFTIIVFSPNSGHSFFGYTFYIVASNSMRPEFEEGDMIIVKTDFSFEEIQIGTDITFVRESDGKIVTHRIRSYADTENGREYTTRGINNMVDDDTTVNFNNIIGVKIKTLVAFGDVITFFRSTVGMIVLFLSFGLLMAGIFISFKFSNDVRAVGK